jgi:long-chain acyl-CoA synthetase
LLTIIYTSGTSGEPKGVCLAVGNLNHMIGCTTERLNQLMAPQMKNANEPDRIFLYAPMNFAASWMLMLSAFSREAVLTLSTDIAKLADEIRIAAPHYFLNVPTLLERVKRGVEDNIAKQAAPIRALYVRAREAWQRQHVGRGKSFDALWLGLGRKLIFARVRSRFGPNLRALICGSAPLAPETQQFFLMLNIPVLQAYGLTETTALCTLDDPAFPSSPATSAPQSPESKCNLPTTTKSCCAAQIFSPATGIAPRKLRKSCATAGSTLAIKAKSTPAATGASSAA